MPPTESFAEYLDAAQEAARRAAAVLDDWRRRFRVHEKARFDLVTEADLESQKTIYEFLGRRFPNHAFLGEEDNTGHERPGVDAPPTWIVDPLDGTTNYVHDVPFYCVSIGLQVAGELVIGVVAAGVVLLREAGGTITNADGSPFDPYTPDAVASNGLLQATLLDCFRSASKS